MSRHAACAALAALLLAAACAPAPQPEPVPPPAEDACGAGPLQRFVGTPFAGMRDSLPDRPTRVIRPGNAVTLDLNPERLNIELEADDRVLRIQCG